jgi:hypothetical protein
VVELQRDWDGGRRWVVGAKRQGWGRMGQDLSCRPRGGIRELTSFWLGWVG